MDLYIVRHAIAEERAAGGDDAERRLTAKGRERFVLHVRALDRTKLRVDAVLHSPWRRARETAELLAPLCERPPVATELLARTPEPALLQAVADAGRRVLIVGHEPWLSGLIGWLVSGTQDHGDLRFALKKGGFAHLRGEARPGAMQLRALWSSRILRLAGA